MADLSESHSDRQQRSGFGLALLLALVPICVVFGSGLLPDREFAFRDIAHYYSPYWQYTQQQWSSFELPLWNPLEENGRPLAADPTAGVFYPGQWIFFLPLPYQVTLKLFLISHLFLAVVCMYAAARSFGRSPLASVLASLTYAFGGSIVFQYCNPIYLIGAAWLPWGVAAIHRLVKDGRGRDTVQLGVVMAMCILGGNPQSAYLLGLLAGIRLCVRNDIQDRGQLQSSSATPSRWQVMARLVAACLLAAGLSAMQLFPAWEWTQGSERQQRDVPQNLYGLLWSTGDRTEDWRAMMTAPSPGSHRDAQYDFSIGPWRWPELLWPNFSGRSFPMNTRWITLLPAEGRFWSPTLYMGILPFFLAVFAVRLRGGSSEQRWLSWCVLIFIVASLGEYGLGWLRNEIAIWLGQAPTDVWGPLGGGYWLMNLVLPGFALFRYPAKLWTLVALGSSLLAAQSFDNLDVSRRPLQKCLAVYITLSLILLVVLVFYQPEFDARWLARATDSAFGPLDQQNALNGLRRTFGVSLAFGGLAWLIFRQQQNRPRLRVALVLLTVVDVSLANAWLAPSVVTPGGSRLMDVKHAERPNTYRWQLGGWYPQDWSRQSDLSRLQRIVAWDVNTLRPKYNLRDGYGALNSSTSFSTARHRRLLDLLKNASIERTTDDFVRLINLLGVDYVMSPATMMFDDVFESVPEHQVAVPDGTRLWKNPNAFPRGWIVHHGVPQATAQDEFPSVAELKALLLDHDLSRSVMLDPDVFSVFAFNDSEASGESVEWCQVVEESPGRIRIEAELNADGFVVIRDSYSPDWSCTRRDTGASLPVLQANGTMRAVPLPAGRHSLSMEYQPGSVWVGGVVSVVCWLALLVVGYVSVRSSGRQNRLTNQGG